MHRLSHSFPIPHSSIIHSSINLIFTDALNCSFVFFCFSVFVYFSLKGFVCVWGYWARIDDNLINNSNGSFVKKCQEAVHSSSCLLICLGDCSMLLFRCIGCKFAKVRSVFVLSTVAAICLKQKWNYIKHAAML